ncbi:hypothetical protein, partial [Cetobacterium sp.]|uniref:hypothetical protein n=1 Tax=Cetobacterium sp. TaxID=2071632 RepID=UPI003F40C304
TRDEVIFLVYFSELRHGVRRTPQKSFSAQRFPMFSHIVSHQGHKQEYPFLELPAACLYVWFPFNTNVWQKPNGFTFTLVIWQTLLSKATYSALNTGTIPLEQHGVKCLAQGHTGGGCWDRTSYLLIYQFSGLTH